MEQQCEKVKEAPQTQLRMWLIVYNIRHEGKGVAVCKAKNARQAEILLRTSGKFNGNTTKYVVLTIEEIIPSPDSMLLAEVNLLETGITVS